MVIDLSRMRSVHVNPANSTVLVQGGATLGDLDRETHIFGLAVPCGIVPKTGIGGLTLGGGVGWLLRKYGMTIDNLLSCQIVTADGRVLTASPSEHEDLFWALRGGGGNFGVVTSFEFQARPVRTVLGGLLLHPRNAAIDLIRFFRDYIEGAPDELTAYAALLHAPGRHAGDWCDRLLLRPNCLTANACCNHYALSAHRSWTRFNPCLFP
jgi:FAD/FMN-containing dehydrogenase